MENNKNQTNGPSQVEPDPKRVPTGRPDLNEINRRNAEEERENRKSSYTVTGLMALVVIAVVTLVYFLT